MEKTFEKNHFSKRLKSMLTICKNQNERAKIEDFIQRNELYLKKHSNFEKKHRCESYCNS